MSKTDTMLDLLGTYRAITPEETLNKIAPLLWDTFGITRVANVTGLDCVGLPVYIAIRPQSKLLTTSQGKGATDLLAKVSAIMESVESWHAESIRPPDCIATPREMRAMGKPLCNLDLAIGLLTHDNIEDRPIAWISTTELNSGETRYIPYSLVCMDFTKKHPGGECFPPSSNGLASGNTYDEAVCHALFEVIERECRCEAQEKHGLNPVSESVVDLNQITHPDIQALIKRIQHNQFELRVTNLTNALGIPTYSAYLQDAKDIRSIGLQNGSGTHLSGRVALLRAITEAIQTRATVISGSRDDIYPNNYKRQKKALEKGAFLSKEPILSKMDFKETEIPGDFVACKEKTLNILAQQGYPEVCCFDHTHPEYGVSVVHIVIPGMRFNLQEHIQQ